MPSFPPWKIAFRFLAFDQMNNELSAAIALQGEDFRTEPEPFHAVAIKGLNVLEYRLQSFFISSRRFPVCRSEINQVELLGGIGGTPTVVPIEYPQGLRCLLRFRDWSN